MKCVIVAVARDENVYINEWVKHHLDLGFDEIRIYDNHSKIPLQTEIDKLPMAYKSRVAVEVEPISYNPQISSYQKALEYYKGKAEWLVYIDIDEFFVIEKPLKEILNRRENIGALFICWQFYNANGQEKFLDKPVRERFTRKCDMLDNCKGKSIVRPESVLAVGVHYPILFNKYVMVNSNNIACHNAAVSPVFADIYINHYYTKSYEEWTWKLYRGTCDSRCMKKYKEFFWYNPDLQYLYDDGLADLQMGFAHNLPTKVIDSKMQNLK